MLISCGVDLGYVDKNGNNALHIACQSGHQDIVKTILKYFYKTNQKQRNKNNGRKVNSPIQDYMKALGGRGSNVSQSVVRRKSILAVPRAVRPQTSFTIDQKDKK